MIWVEFIKQIHKFLFINNDNEVRNIKNVQKQMLKFPLEI